MSNPTTDRGAITRILTGLTEAGWTLVEVADDTWNPDERQAVSTVHEATEAIMAVDEGWVFLSKPEAKSQYIYFVLGNDPEEVAADYTVGLDPDLSAITDPWWE